LNYTRVEVLEKSTPLRIRAPQVCHYVESAFSPAPRCSTNDGSLGSRTEVEAVQSDGEFVLGRFTIGTGQHFTVSCHHQRHHIGGTGDAQ